MVESSGLLNRRRPLKSTEGSNPSLSASLSLALRQQRGHPPFVKPSKSVRILQKIKGEDGVSRFVPVKKTSRGRSNAAAQSSTISSV